MKRTALASGLLTFLLLLASCEREGVQVDLSVGPFNGETRKVMLYYEAGFNSLSRYIAENIATLKKGYVPGKGRQDDVLLVFSHLTRSSRDYAVETEPVLVRLYTDLDKVVADTLKVWPSGTSAANAAMVREVFSLVRELFPAAGYGAVLSSHATGWLPEGYFSDPKRYEGNDRNAGSGGIDIWNAPRRRTFGSEYVNATRMEEIEMADLAKAIPYHLDYILFDACLMGTVEVAWELRDVCDYLIFTPTETPGPGFDYSTLTRSLLSSGSMDLESVCEDFWGRYGPGGTESYYGACITMLDCRKLEPLAAVCKELFEAYRAPIRQVDGRKVQTYDRLYGGKHYYVFFDLKDLLREAGAGAEELSRLQAALDEAVLYENHTVETVYSPPLERCCGLSVYLPAYPDYRADTWHGTEFLDGFYKKNVAWNEATSLVE